MAVPAKAAVRKLDKQAKPPDRATVASLLAFPTSPAIQRKSNCACGGSCPTCSKNLEIQRQVAVGKENDEFEREADDVATSVMAAGAGDAEDPLFPTISRMPESGGTDDDTVATKSRSTNNGVAAGPPTGSKPRPVSSSELLRGGRPLPSHVRIFYEARFGWPMGYVRVHTGGKAAGLTEQLNANAFTYGNHVWLGAGHQVAPSFLLAHELTHVIQQTGGSAMAMKVQRKKKNPLAKYFPRLKGTEFGTKIHKPIQKYLREANSELVTEAPMPGANTRRSGYGHERVGEADLYTSKPSRTISGIKGKGASQFVELKKPKAAESDGGVIEQLPKPGATPGTFDHGFVTKFWIGEIKPGSRGSVRKGAKQTHKYKTQHVEFIKKAINEGKIKGNPPVAESLKQGTSAAKNRLVIPAHMDYDKFETAKSSTTAKTDLVKTTGGSPQRLWLYNVKNSGVASGLYVYVDLPKDIKQGNFKDRVEKLDTHLDGLNEAFTKKHAKLRRSPKKKPKDKAEWDPAHKAWTGKVDTLFKDRKDALDKAYIDEMLDISGPKSLASFGKRARRLDLWGGPIGPFLGKLGFTFQRAIGKIGAVWEKAKLKFQNFKKRFKSVHRPGVSGWKKTVFVMFLKAAKVAFGQLLEHAKGKVVNCFNGLMTGLFDKIKATFDDFEIAKKATSELQKWSDLLEKVELKIKDYLAEIESQYKVFVDFIKTGKKIFDWFGRLITTARGIMLAITCAAGVGFGCVVGIIGQFFMDDIIDLVAKTKKFKDTVNDIACKLMTKKLSVWYGAGIEKIVEAAGLTKFAQDVNAPCFAKKDEKFPCTPPSGGIPEGDYDKLREEWERSKELKKLETKIKAKLTINGKPVTEREIKDISDTAESLGIKKERVEACIKSSFISGGNIDHAKVILCLIQPPPPPPQNKQGDGDGKGGGQGKGDGQGGGKGKGDGQGGGQGKGDGEGGGQGDNDGGQGDSGGGQGDSDGGGQQQDDGGQQGDGGGKQDDQDEGKSKDGGKDKKEKDGGRRHGEGGGVQEGSGKGRGDGSGKLREGSRQEENNGKGDGDDDGASKPDKSPGGGDSSKGAEPGSGPQRMPQPSKSKKPRSDLSANAQETIIAILNRLIERFDPESPMVERLRKERDWIQGSKPKPEAAKKDE